MQNKQQYVGPQRCTVLEEQFVELMISAMERVETKSVSDQDDNHWLWLHLSCQLINFVLYQFVVFPNIVNALHEKVSTS